jgi:excisionase family DNA binding protein
MENTEENEPMVLSVIEAGRLAGLSRVSAYNMVRQGVIPSIRFGRRLVVPKKALMDLLNGSGKVGR